MIISRKTGTEARTYKRWRPENLSAIHGKIRWDRVISRKAAPTTMVLDDRHLIQIM
jgi:hypothetical protein